ncbi:MAG: YceI family protein [Bacteroidetes bacterium]|nr:YceI family protein [Bacteroidota bacterium]
MSIRLFLLFAPIFFTGFAVPSGSVFTTKNGTVHFVSDAPLEVIQATSKELKGAIDTDQNTFAFAVDMETFQGFNSPLQQVHFYENYLEIRRFKKATFTGKIIEKTDFATDGTYTIRAKGKLEIHGVALERIIKSDMTVKNGKLLVHSEFTVLLDEHDIAIPKIVYQKITEEIKVQVDAEFSKT